MYYKFNAAMAYLQYVLRHPPGAAAEIKGSERYPGISGLICFYPLRGETLVTVDVQGLPAESDPCPYPVFGFHIHVGGRCQGNAADPFAETDGHYNRDGCEHPYHNGDMPPLFASRDRAWMAFLTDRFTVEEIIGRTVVIHEHPDDFHTQPAGNAGMKIACGEIVAV